MKLKDDKNSDEWEGTEGNEGTGDWACEGTEKSLNIILVVSKIYLIISFHIYKETHILKVFSFKMSKYYESVGNFGLYFHISNILLKQARKLC